MLYFTTLLAFLLTAPVFVASFCYECDDEIVVNYLVTSERLPPLSDCRTVDKTMCIMNVIWNESANITSLQIFGIEFDSTKPNIDDSLTAFTDMQVVPDTETIVFTRGFLLICMLTPNCNDKNNLQRLLQSLVFEDQLQEELVPLIKVVSPFDPNSASCLDFSNFTEECPDKNLEYCERCYILLDQFSTPGEEICARCPVPTYAPANEITHTKVFAFNDQIVLNDQVEMGCQIKGCNSIENVNQVFKASKITFNSNKYIRN